MIRSSIFTTRSNYILFLVVKYKGLLIRHRAISAHYLSCITQMKLNVTTGTGKASLLYLDHCLKVRTAHIYARLQTSGFLRAVHSIRTSNMYAMLRCAATTTVHIRLSLFVVQIFYKRFFLKNSLCNITFLHAFTSLMFHCGLELLDMYQLSVRIAIMPGMKLFSRI